MATRNLDKQKGEDSSLSLEVQNGWRFSKDASGNMIIIGTVKNRGDRKFNRTEVTFNLFGESGAPAGTAIAIECVIDDMENFPLIAELIIYPCETRELSPFI